MALTGWFSAKGLHPVGKRVDRYVGAGDEHEWVDHEPDPLGGLSVAGCQSQTDEEPEKRESTHEAHDYCEERFLGTSVEAETDKKTQPCGHHDAPRDDR